MSTRIAALSVLIVLAGTPAPGQTELPPADLKIAFLGDQGLGAEERAVLQLVRSEGADAMVLLGDFDYNDDPQAWEDQWNAVLGPDFPCFAVAGNHDEAQFYASGGYQERLAARMNRLAIPWQGDLGVQSAFRWRGILFLQTAPDIFPAGTGDGVHDVYIRSQLANDDSVWRVSAWHKNMRLMQVGSKDDDTGWGVYEESRKGGAIIATAHEHSYSRTHLLQSCPATAVESTDNTLVLSRDDPGTPSVDEGRSFVFVSGLGGASIRDQDRGGPWWAAIYTSDQGAQHGALFGVFHYAGNPHLAWFYFKDVGGNVVDSFYVKSSLGGSWNLEGPATAGGPPIRFAATADPSEVGNLAFLFLSLGDGSASGGIPIPLQGSLGRRLLLDPDTLFAQWQHLPSGFRAAALGGSPHASGVTTPLPIPATAPVGLRLFYAGFTMDPAGTAISVTPTRSFEVQS